MENKEYDSEEMLSIMVDGARAIRKTGEKPWHYALQNKFQELHPSVIKAVKIQRPDNWQDLILQWPHVSEKDGTQIAYTRDERKGQDDVQTRTSVGKYLKMHFRSMPDHTIRDIVALFHPSECKFVKTMEDILYHLERGPTSCMVWEGQDHDDHPYQVYAIKYGWHMAVRIEEGDTVGRALCNEKTYVRSYNKAKDGGYSYSDQQLESWLNDQGYRKKSSWLGFKLEKIKSNRKYGFLAPYIDGADQGVSDCGQYFEIIHEGDYIFNNTNGEATEKHNSSCADCDETCDEDDLVAVGYHEDHHICSSCQNNEYTYVIGRRGAEYYAPSDEAVYSDDMDSYYHQNYLSDNEIVELLNGDYVHLDNAICIDDDWYRSNDEDIVQLKDGDYALLDNCWLCEHSGDYYLNDDDDEKVETLGGKTIHSDYSDEYETEEENEPSAQNA